MRNANSLELVPSFEFHGPHSRYYRLRIGPSLDNFYSVSTFSEQVDSLISFMDKDIYDYFYLDLINFPKQFHITLSKLLSHPKLIISPSITE